MPTGRDQRSVGELLTDVDRAARDLLFDVSAADADAMVNAWPALASAARRLWEALPGRPTDAWASDLLDQPLRRVDALAEAAGQRARRHGWPTTGFIDARFGEWCAMWERAARMVERYASEIPAEKAGPRADIDLARARVLHGLYVANHAATLAVRGRIAGVQRTPLDHRLMGGRVAADRALLRGATSWLATLNTSERTLYGATQPSRVGARAAADHGVRPDLAVVDRWERALAVFDIQAHRALVRPSSAAAAHLVCRVQALVGSTTGRVLADPSESSRSGSVHDPVVLDAVAVTGQAWAGMARSLRDLGTPYDSVPDGLAAAASECRTTAALLVEGLPGLHPAELAGAARSCLEAAINGYELAGAVTDYSRRPDLTGPARLLSRRTEAQVEAEVKRGSRLDEDTIWVSAADVVRNRTVDVPEPMRQALGVQATRLRRAASVAAHAASRHPMVASGSVTQVDAAGRGTPYLGTHRTPGRPGVQGGAGARPTWTGQDR